MTGSGGEQFVEKVIEVLRAIFATLLATFQGVVAVVGWVLGHALLLGGLVLLGLGTWRLLCLRAALRQLRDREVVFASAVDEWDPGEEELRRAASILARERPHPLGRAGRARRIRLDSAPAGRVLYAYELPADVARALRASVGESIELRGPETLDLAGLRGVTAGPPADAMLRDDPDEGEDPALVGLTDLTLALEDADNKLAAGQAVAVTAADSLEDAGDVDSR